LGLDPAIQAASPTSERELDRRVKPGDDSKVVGTDRLFLALFQARENPGR